MSDNKYVLTVQYDDKERERLDRLRQSLGASTNRELVRRALDLLSLLANAMEQPGATLVIRTHTDGRTDETTVAFPFHFYSQRGGRAADSSGSGADGPRVDNERRSGDADGDGGDHRA